MLFGIICLISGLNIWMCGTSSQDQVLNRSARRGFTLVHNIHNFRADGKTKRKRKSTVAAVDL